MSRRPFALAAVIALAWGCASTPVKRPTPRCTPRCEAHHACGALDEILVAARKAMLSCVAVAGARSDLAQTHRCHRALRLLENARWLLRTTQADRALDARVYNTPISLRTFYCRVESLAAAKTPAEVEKRYIELVRAYP